MDRDDDVHNIIYEAAMNESICELVDMNLTVLPRTYLWDYIKVINCRVNRLRNLPRMSRVISIDCTVNKLSLIYHMQSLQYLHCASNNIVKLPRLPNLKILDCSHNRLEIIPQYENLEDLRCDNNYLTSLPQLDRVQRISCDRNRIEYLPPMAALMQISCTGNPIIYIPIFPKICRITLNRAHPLYKLRHYRATCAVHRYLLARAMIIRARRAMMRRRERRWRAVLAEIVCRPGTGAEYHRGLELIDANG